jgi:hypothetical protein
MKVQNPNGHRVVLNVTVEPATIEDLLKLGFRSDPPVITVFGLAIAFCQDFPDGCF